MARLILLSLGLSALAGAAAPGAPGDLPAQIITPAFITQLAEELRTNHPALQAAAARTDAAAAAAQAVRVWPDPMFTLGGMIADEEMRAEDGDISYGLEQRLPLFGRPKLARITAEAELGVEQAAGEAAFQTRRRDLARALFQAALADEIVTIGTEDVRWLAGMEATTDQRYRAGESTLVDLLRIQTEQAKQTNRLRTDQLQLRHARLVLNRQLNRDLESPWPTLLLPPVAGPVVYDARLVGFALKFEPALKARTQETRAAEAMARMIRRDRAPEVILGARGRNYTGTGEFRQAELMLGFSLPWGNAGKYRQDYDRALARARAAEREAADYVLDLREEVHRLTLGIDAARREALLYRDELRPRAERALESAHAAWIAGRGMFLDVLEARRMLLEARLMHARALAEQYDQLSDLVLCCGLGDFEALEMIGAQPETAAASPP